MVTTASGVNHNVTTLVRGTRLPIVYVSHLRTFLVLYLLSLPFVYVSFWGWAGTTRVHPSILSFIHSFIRHPRRPRRRRSPLACCSQSVSVFFFFFFFLFWSPPT